MRLSSVEATQHVWQEGFAFRPGLGQYSMWLCNLHTGSLTNYDACRKSQQKIERPYSTYIIIYPDIYIYTMIYYDLLVVSLNLLEYSDIYIFGDP
jgi:hypothetical protein